MSKNRTNLNLGKPDKWEYQSMERIVYGTVASTFHLLFAALIVHWHHNCLTFYTTDGSCCLRGFLSQNHWKFEPLDVGHQDPPNLTTAGFQLGLQGDLRTGEATHSLSNPQNASLDPKTYFWFVKENWKEHFFHLKWAFWKTGKLCVVSPVLKSLSGFNQTPAPVIFRGSSRGQIHGFGTCRLSNQQVPNLWMSQAQLYFYSWFYPKMQLNANYPKI